MTPADTRDGAASREYLSFQVGEQGFCIDILTVRELRGWTTATPLPRSPAYMRGVVNLRGTVLPVVDMAVRLGMPSPEPTPRHVIVVVAIGTRTVGLLVDRVCEIVAIPDSALQPAPDLRTGSAEGLVTALATIDDQMMGLLSLDRVIPEEEVQAA